MKTKFKYLLQLVLFLLIATNIFGADAPPVTEDFEAGVLPHSGWVAWPYFHYYNSPWTFTTNGTGRIEIAVDKLIAAKKRISIHGISVAQWIGTAITNMLTNIPAVARTDAGITSDRAIFRLSLRDESKIRTGRKI